MSALLFGPDAVFITGVEDDPGGIGVRVFIGHRYKGAYFLISEPDAVEKARLAWNGSHGHVLASYDELVQVGIRLNEDGSPPLRIGEQP